jgi:hypothetical protein
MNPRPVFFQRLAVLVACIFSFASATSNAAEPEFRPALVGRGPKSLVNLIDIAKLRQAGQGDSVVTFEQFIFPFSVKGAYATVYPGSSGSEALQKAVLHALDHAQFIPAIADHQKAAVDFRGTVMFFAKQEPHLRVFANQDRNELGHLADFVAPQLIWWLNEMGLERSGA